MFAPRAQKTAFSSGFIRVHPRFKIFVALRNTRNGVTNMLKLDGGTELGA
jgi:hypothetical protein